MSAQQALRIGYRRTLLRRWACLGVLAALLLLGSVVGAQFGARFAQKARPEYLRLALAVIVLLVALELAVGLFIRPDEIYSVQ